MQSQQQQQQQQQQQSSYDNTAEKVRRTEDPLENYYSSGGEDGGGDSGGRLALKGLEAAADASSAARANAQLRKLFVSLDSDGSGRLERTEVVMILAS